jgi:GPI mannosyltransferase 3
VTGGLRGLYFLLAAALAIRLVAYATFGGIMHADEIFQYAEPAHRVVFGDGLVPWEYRLGIRSWLFPGMLAAVMELTRVAGDGPVVQNWAVAIAISIASLPMVACGVLWARRAAGWAGGVCAGVLLAAWPGQILFSLHPLIDSIGADVLVPGIYLLERAVARRTPASLGAAGALLGLTLALRIQLLPAVVWGILRFCRREIRFGYVPALAGLGVVLALAGMLDWVTLGAPFQSVIKYVWVNQVARAATYFGTDPWWYYLLVLPWSWGLAFPVLALCMVRAAIRLPRLAEVGFTIVASFSLVPHKELRFIYPAFPFLLTLAGAGAADWGRVLTQRVGVAARWAMLVPALLGGLCVLDGVAGNGKKLWVRGTGIVAEMHRVAADSQACALAIVPPENWYLTGGYTHLRPGIRLVAFTPDGAAGKVAGFDYAIAGGGTDLTPWGMSRLECRRNMMADEAMPLACLWHNPVGCDGARLPELALPDPPFLRWP